MHEVQFSNLPRVFYYHRNTILKILSVQNHLPICTALSTVDYHPYFHKQEAEKPTLFAFTRLRKTLLLVTYR